MRNPVNKQAFVRPPKGGLVYEPVDFFPGDLEPHDQYREAWHDLIDAKMVKSRKFEEQTWRAMRIGAHPETIRFYQLFQRRMAQYNVPVFASEIVRTHERQKQLKAEGVSRAEGAKAPHPYGMAVDIIHSVRGWGLSQKQWEFFGHVGKELVIQRSCAMTWGGDWPPLKEGVGWDPAHWQRVNWRADMADFPFMPKQGRYTDDVR